MNKPIVRIEKIWIKNFKNVGYGQLSFENNRKAFNASVLGLYGQNGSGKTALLDVIEILKLALSGQPVPLRFADYINVDCEYTTLKYEFKVKTTNGTYDTFYEFSIRKEFDVISQNTESHGEDTVKYKTTVFDEVLSYSYISNEEKYRLGALIDTKTADIFVPKSKFDILVGKDKEDITDLLVAKRITLATSRAFIFSRELLSIIRKNYAQKKGTGSSYELERHVTLLESLVEYGNFGLFVINTSNSGLISLNALPLAFRYEENNKRAVGQLAIPLNDATTIPIDTLDVVKKIICNMNIVLSQIVPGLTISVKELGQQVLKNGQVGCRLQLMSNKNSREIALQYESEGIKKIISILQLLIVVYNKSSITVAIDELDAGVFEYLLGELLKIISEKGKGQLIFTSHNLRPLETIDKGFVAFTTTNSQNRYIRFNHVKDNNNLRDFYFRDIILGEQSEIVYEPTNNYEISLAFREAGENIGP
ncbi:AAA family ATPase [Roseburia hominis]